MLCFAVLGGGSSTAFAVSSKYSNVMTDLQKDAYRRQFGIKRSDCYEVWGMKRTGCACCPFGKEFEQELSLAEKYEPKLFTAAQEIFGQSYDYTRRFMEFRKTKKRFFKERRR